MQKPILFFVFLLCFTCAHAQDSTAQVNVVSDHRYDMALRRNQVKALAMLRKEDTTLASPYWPHVKPALFFANLRQNILYPQYINQGKSTNFCGYAAMTHLLLRYHPDIYLQQILALYHNGEARLKKRTLKPSERVRKAAGMLKNKGELDMLHANQLWFLTLADQFKGYMNFVDHKFNMGDENKIWAGTNYGKFNRMLTHFTDDQISSRGSDLSRPKIRDLSGHASGELKKGVVLLFVNSKYLYPHKYSLFKLRAPTHFIVLYDLYPVGDMLEMQYWDYGLRTEQQISQKRLRDLIYGITTITHISDE